MKLLAVLLLLSYFLGLGMPPKRAHLDSTDSLIHAAHSPALAVWGTNKNIEGKPVTQKDFNAKETLLLFLSEAYFSVFKGHSENFAFILRIFIFICSLRL